MIFIGFLGQASREIEGDLSAQIRVPHDGTRWRPIGRCDQVVPVPVWLVALKHWPVPVPGVEGTADQSQSKMHRFPLGSQRNHLQPPGAIQKWLDLVYLPTSVKTLASSDYGAHLTGIRMLVTEMLKERWVCQLILGISKFCASLPRHTLFLVVSISARAVKPIF